MSNKNKAYLETIGADFFKIHIKFALPHAKLRSWIASHNVGLYCNWDCYGVGTFGTALLSVTVGGC